MMKKKETAQAQPSITSDYSMLSRRISNFLKRRLGIHGKKSYSQCGEDLIIQHVLDSLGIAKPLYMDIGAHHPSYINNTYTFYKQGGRGINIEPDPSLIRKFRRMRPRDTNLNIGIGPDEKKLDFYVLTNRTLNTFAQEEAKRYVEEFGQKIVDIIPIEVKKFNNVVDRYCSRSPDLVSLDVEGLDLAILKSIDFSRCRPLLFCIETITYSETGEGTKIAAIDTVMADNGYMKYADTYINTIFLDKERWCKR
jgi:FkbM family methyltransferase